MKKIWKKNQIIITTLAIMIAIAGYLNYSGKILEEETAMTVNDSDLIFSTQDSMDTANLEEGYEDIISLDDDGMEDTVSENSSANVGEAVLASSMGGGQMLAAAKLNRDQVRAKSKEELQAIVDNAELTEEQKSEAVTVMAQMADNADREAQAELLLEAKGFPGSVVSISEDTVDVAVEASELSTSQRAQIEDIVKRKTSVSGDKIVITPAES